MKSEHYVCVVRAWTGLVKKTTGGRLWGCNWGVTGLVYFWSMCRSSPGDQQLSMCQYKGKSWCLPPRRSNDQMQVSDNQHGFWPSVWAQSLQRVCLRESAVHLPASLSSASLWNLRPQIAGEKTTKSSSLSLCDSLGLLPKQIGLARRGPLHHLSSGRMKKRGKRAVFSSGGLRPNRHVKVHQMTGILWGAA